MSTYLKVNLSNSDFLNKLKYHINNNIPLSLTRFGDGEIHIININQKIKHLAL